jgi:uncharacterized protein
MGKLSPLQRKLDKALSGLPSDSDAMLLSELDGFVAGILVCPDLILPGEWLPLVWGGEDEERIIFESMQHARDVTGMVIEHYNTVSDTLQRGKGYAAIFDVDAGHDETLWEIWIEGFEAAVHLRPSAWLKMIESCDEIVAQSFGVMMNLADVAHGNSELSQEAIDRLTLEAPDLIPAFVGILHEWRLENYSAPIAPPPSEKTGRNDPCPCGSGKKYKKCCLLN